MTPEAAAEGHDAALAGCAVPRSFAGSRVAVLGCPGSGKSTFSREVARLSGLPLIHLDDHYWGPDWTRAEAAHWQEAQARLAAADEWIIDGNFLDGVPVRIERATVTVIFHVPSRVCAWRALIRIARAYGGKLDGLPGPIRQQISRGKRVPYFESIRHLLWKVLRFNRTDFPKTLDALARHRAGRVVVVVDTRFGASEIERLRRTCNPDRLIVLSASGTRDLAATILDEIAASRP